MLLQDDERFIIAARRLGLRGVQSTEEQFFASNDGEKNLIDRQRVILRQARQTTEFYDRSSFETSTSRSEQTMDQGVFVARVQQ